MVIDTYKIQKSLGKGGGGNRKQETEQDEGNSHRYALIQE